MASIPFPHFPLKNGRAHEVQGPSATFFALACAGHLNGPVLWIRENWQSGQLNPNGFSDLTDPAKLLMANVESQLDLLASAEEALRSGAVVLVVMEISKPIGLTEGRRLQLAAREGKSTALTIIPQGAGSNAAETRWHSTAVFDPTEDAGVGALQSWKLLKNKSGALGEWQIRWDRSQRCPVVAPESES